MDLNLGGRNYYHFPPYDGWAFNADNIDAYFDTFALHFSLIKTEPGVELELLARNFDDTGKGYSYYSCEDEVVFLFQYCIPT